VRVVLMVSRVFVGRREREAWPKPQWTNSPAACVAVTWLIVLVTGLHAYLVARRVSRPLESEPSLRERLLGRYERGRFHHQIGLFVLFILSLLVFGWGWAVAKLWYCPGHTLPGADLLVLAPFVGPRVSPR